MILCIYLVIEKIYGGFWPYICFLKGKRNEIKGESMSNLRMLLIMCLGLWLNISQATVKKTDCLHQRNKVCHLIMKLNNKIENKDAYKLSNIFSKVSRKYKLDPRLLVSIAFQESSFKKDAVRKVKGLVYDEALGKYKQLAVGADFCMMQIHMSNIKKMNLSVKKLLENTRYCVEAGAKILSRYKKKHSKVDEIWWTYYNANTKAKRKIYYNKVIRHLDKLSASSARIIASLKE